MVGFGQKFHKLDGSQPRDICEAGISSYMTCFYFNHLLLLSNNNDHLQLLFIHPKANGCKLEFLQKQPCQLIKILISHLYLYFYIYIDKGRKVQKKTLAKCLKCNPPSPSIFTMHYNQEVRFNGRWEDNFISLKKLSISAYCI